MSTLDHAFIRAYTGDAEPRSAAAKKIVQEDSVAQSPGRGWRVKPGASRPGTVVPPPHISMAAFGNAAVGSPAFSFSSSTVEAVQALDAAPTDVEAPVHSEVSDDSAWGHFEPAAANASNDGEDPPRAAYEVDHFAWPDLCRKLSSQLAPQFDELAQQLLAESALGRKAIALAGTCRGEGRTTLALMLAQRLAGAGAKVVLVDADFDSPQLAARLGLGVAGGWQQTLVDGQPVWEAMVESLDDHLAILPLVPRSTTLENASPTQTAAEFTCQHSQAIRRHLDELRQHFDVILVDAGPEDADHAAAKAQPRGRRLAASTRPFSSPTRASPLPARWPICIAVCKTPTSSRWESPKHFAKRTRRRTRAAENTHSAAATFRSLPAKPTSRQNSHVQILLATRPASV